MDAERVTYTPEEYALALKVSVKTIYRQIRAGTLRAERIGKQYRIVRFRVRTQEATS